MKLDKITPAILKMLREDMTEALKPVLKKYGLSELKAGSASYGTNNFTMKVEGILSLEAKKEENISQAKQYAHLLGLPEDIVGKIFSSNGKTFEVERLDLGKPKFPIIAKDVATKKMYKFPVDSVKNKL